MNTFTLMSQYISKIYGEIQNVDLCFTLLTILVAAIAVLLVPLFFKLYKWGRLLILNARLKYIPLKSEIKNLSAFHRLVLLPFNYPGFLLNFTLFLLFSTIISLFDCMVLEKEMLPMIFKTISISVFFIVCLLFIWIWYKRKDLKGLVGIIATNLKDVSNSENRDDDKIHFAHCYNSEEGNISYEKRLPFQNKKEIEKERNRVIVDYYTDLKEKIIKNKSSKYSSYFMVNYKGKELHICDFLKDYAYNTESIWKAVCKVDKRMHKEHLINFIGDKVGVWNYELEGDCIHGKTLTLSTYHTDHFTFHVFKEIFHNDDFKDTFQLFIRRVNLVDEKTRKYMVQCLKFLFSSFGIDITINTRDARGNKVMLVGLRNGAIERLGNDKLHVPVNESFSNTDLTRDEELSPLLCVQRGIVEELGIPEDMVKKAIIKFYDFAIVSDEGEIGLSCNADFSSIIPVEEMRCYPGQDKFLEIKNLIAVPYPPFYWDEKKYPYYFYKTTHNDALCAQWESFTPLLYQRIIVRKTSLGKIWELILNFAVLSFLSVILLLVYDDIVFYDKWKDYLDTTIQILFFNLFIQGFLKFVGWICRYEYSYIMPLVPQWNGDVKVYQCNDNLRMSKSGGGAEDNFIASELTFGISLSDIHNKKRDNDIKIKWDNIRLKEPPYCYVRREISEHRESPISFYRVFEDTKNTEQNKLFFCVIPFYCRNGYITFNINIKIDEKKKYYHFSKLLTSNELPPLSFKEMLKQEEINSYSRYFGIEEELLKIIIKANIDKSFQNQYIPMDLMGYQGNYYWSVYEKNPTFPSPDGDNVNKINGKTDIYNKYIKNINRDTSLWFHCKVEDALIVLSNFIAYPENRKRISTVDIYMLQLALIRKNVGCGKLLAIKKKPKWNFMSDKRKKKYIQYESKIQDILHLS